MKRVNLLLLAPRCPLEIPNGEISDPCDNKMGESCNYICDEGFRPITTDIITCDEDGKWSLPIEDLCSK